MAGLSEEGPLSLQLRPTWTPDPQALSPRPQVTRVCGHLLGPKPLCNFPNFSWQPGFSSSLCKMVKMGRNGTKQASSHFESSRPG